MNIIWNINKICHLVRGHQFPQWVWVQKKKGKWTKRYDRCFFCSSLPVSNDSQSNILLKDTSAGANTGAWTSILWFKGRLSSSVFPPFPWRHADLKQLSDQLESPQLFIPRLFHLNHIAQSGDMWLVLPVCIIHLLGLS